MDLHQPRWQPFAILRILCCHHCTISVASGKHLLFRARFTCSAAEVAASPCRSLQDSSQGSHATCQIAMLLVRFATLFGKCLEDLLLRAGERVVAIVSPSQCFSGSPQHSSPPNHSKYRQQIIVREVERRLGEAVQIERVAVAKRYAPETRCASEDALLIPSISVLTMGTRSNTLAEEAWYN